MKFRIFALVFLTMMIMGSFGLVPSLPMQVVIEPIQEVQQLLDTEKIPEDVMPLIEQTLAQDDDTPSATYPADYDFGQVLGDRVNEYKTVYEPWRSKAAIHAIAYHRPTGFLALGGGYLYDNEIHIFRLNSDTKLWDKVWDSGDSILTDDVMCLAFGDTDLNDFLEIVAGCKDGRIYVFEQTHIYDPHANTENRFELVWISPDMFRVFDVKIADVDKDYRPDIIVGAWDGYVHLFEYFNHSYYPFEEEHWIDYVEVSKLEVGEKVYTLETADTNTNGLPEIIVGTREGTVYVFENAGINIIINGYPFPLIYDNHYYLNWTSENYTWTPIQSMSAGELDGTPGEEIALVAQGQGVLILDWNPSRRTYDYEKVYRDYELWETFGFWGLDEWVDRVIEANNVTYHDPLNASLIVPEPIQYTWNEGLKIFLPDASVYPYNTGMATFTDGNYSTFDASPNNIHNATAVVDFGLDEEGTGGVSAAEDVIVEFRDSLDEGIKTDFNISVSQDGLEFEQIDPARTWYSSNTLYVDVDDALSHRKWDWFRYIKLSVFNNATYEINSLKLVNIYNTLTDSLSVTIGPLDLFGESYLQGTTEPNKIIIGSVTGEFTAVMWNDEEADYDVIWDSGDDAFYSFGANIWDIQHVENIPNVPTWNQELIGGLYSTPFEPDTGLTFNSWHFGLLDTFENWHYLMGTQQGQIRGYTAGPAGFPQLNPDLNLQLASINDYLSDHYEYTSVEVAYLATEYNEQPMLVVGGFNPGAPLGEASAGQRAGLMFYYRADVLDPFEDKKDLAQIDHTGELTQLLDVSRATPKVDFNDIDGDLDYDMVISNGYLYLAKNLWQETQIIANFSLVRGYFDDINKIETSKIWGQPELIDLDEDGDLDLILSYANSNGATFFRNEGTSDDPIWVQDKKVFSNPTLTGNMKYLNLTDIRVFGNWGGFVDGFLLERYYEATGQEFESNYYIGAHNTFNDTTFWMTPRFGTTDSYIIASYPKVAQIDFSIMSPGRVGGYLFNNLGFHVHESWSNEDDLEDWSLCIASGDIDGDGKGEMIVGDYDNNVYVFEHLTNNTYKRMYSTFDLNHTIKTDISPYYYEELEGISGEFYRKIWDHAEHLVVDVDLDQDGLKEMIVATGLQIYVFEDKGLFGGDELTFVYSIDLRDNEFSEVWFSQTDIGPGMKEYNPKLRLFKPWDQVEKITAMAAGDDIDYDGRIELAVAAGPFLFCFNVPVGEFNGTENNDFFVTSPELAGRYFLVGNPAMYQLQFFEINAMVMCDTDKDDYRELIIGGTNGTYLQKPFGFVYIYECQGGSFYQAWSAPEELTYWNPVTVIKLDDQDYDGEQEIIIGHQYGFDMWEHIPDTDSQYQKVEHVTASPNYPIVPLKSAIWEAFGEEYTPYLPPYTSGGVPPIIPDYHKDMAHMHGEYSDFVWMVYENSTCGSSQCIPEIWYKLYSISGGIWSGGVKLNTEFTYPSITIVAEWNPSITIAENNDFYIAWEAESDTATHYLCVVYYDVSASSWSNVEMFEDTYGNTGPPLFWPTGTLRSNPSIFEYNATHIGVAYVYDYYILTIWTYDKVGCSYISKDLTGSWYSDYPQFKERNDFFVHDISIIKLNDSDFAIAMSAYNSKTSKADYDIWVVIGNEEFNFTNSCPHQATTSYDNEMWVDIAELTTDYNMSLVVIYEILEAQVEDRIGMVASTSKGSLWHHPETMNTLPDYIDRFETPVGYVYYQMDGTPVYGPMAYAPTVIPWPDGGFMYAISFVPSIFEQWTDHQKRPTWILLPDPDLVYGINIQSDWTGNWLREVVDLDVGDTDNDGRREVVVGFLNQVGVYELKHSTNGTDFMSYEEVWLSNPFENPVTGVTVYDTSGNGWENIGVSTERGEVYFLEFSDPSEGPTNLIFSQRSWNVSTTGWGNIWSYDTLLAYDIDNDSKDEIIAGTTFGANFTFALDDDGTILWNNSGFELPMVKMLLHDLNNDSIPEIICAAGYGSQDGALYVLNITNGNVLWSFPDPTHQVVSLDVGDLDLDGDPEIVFGATNGDLWVLNHTGGLVNYTSVSSEAIWTLAIGNYTGRNVSAIAFVQHMGSLKILDIFNGSYYYESPDSTAFYTIPIKAYDFNDDGIDEVLFGWDTLKILDPVTGIIYYNATFFGVAVNTHIADFDGDNDIEVLFQTPYGGIFLEEISSGTTQWHYNPDLTMISDVAFGDFGGTGDLDIAVCTGDGVAVVLDGKNGIPIWFNITGGLQVSVLAADLHGEGIDSLIVWDGTNETIFVTEGLEPYYVEKPPEWEVHGIYWEKQFSEDTVIGTWVADLLGDEREEILVADDNHGLFLINGTTGSIIWNRTVEGDVKEVRFGNMDGQGAPDLAVLQNPHVVYLIDAASGNNFTRIEAPKNNRMVSCIIGPFSNKDEHPNDELCILFWEKGTNQIFAKWYDDKGSELYRVNKNFTSSDYELHLAAGNLTGYATWDILYGGSSVPCRLFYGFDGTQEFEVGDNCYGIVVGNFLADEYEEFATLESNGDITIWDVIWDGSEWDPDYLSRIEIASVEYIRDFYAADLYLNDGIDEVVVNAMLYGVLGFDALANEVWRFETPLVVSALDSSCDFGDADGDGHIDLIFSNWNYIDVISGATERLLWHYRSDARCTYPKVGHFYDMSYPLDVLTYFGNGVYIVSGSKTPPTPPPIPIVRVAGARSLADVIIETTLTFVPIGILIIMPVAIIWKKKRKRE